MQFFMDNLFRFKCFEMDIFIYEKFAKHVFHYLKIIVKNVCHKLRKENEYAEYKNKDIKITGK